MLLEVASLTFANEPQQESWLLNSC